ncbi:organic cation transporter protein-like [Actinia tenebrosa]|uniref:Organic cation transporter protein-like n=1 Tax=Actinia tenebrosa TaxID=6105 RepID=A0A6P8HLS3_ACTTE|nr:organic cation transporter protein-like [Actinia tenebrosa]
MDEKLGSSESTPKSPLERSEGHEFDDVFNHVKSFGRYQKIVYFSLHMLIFPITTQFDALVFAFSTPNFHCETANVTCPSKKCCKGCTSYVFDGPFNSTVSEWNLVCDRAYLGAIIQSCYFAGMTIGSFATGMISDAWGRKKCIFFSTAIMLLGGIGSSVVDCISFLGFLRFVVGFGLSGAMLALYIYCVELVGPKRRTLVGNITFVYFSGFGIGAVFFAYFIREWRMLLLVLTLPAVLLFPFWRVMPESPRWLIANNKLDEAERILMKFGGKRGRPIDRDQLRKLILDVREDQVNKEASAKRYTPLDLVRTAKMRKWAIIMSYQWFVVALVSFGILLFVSQLAGSVYLNFLIITTAQAFKVVLTYFVFLKFGRRIGHAGFIVLVGTILLLVLAVNKDYPWATTVLSLLGYILIDCNWTGVYIITPELFPTVLRNTAQGTGSTSARIGGILAPFVAMMSQLPGFGIAGPVIIFGVLALIAGVMMYWIPETLYAPMHQTIEEAEAAKEDFGIPCFGGRNKTALEVGSDIEISKL